MVSAINVPAAKKAWFHVDMDGLDAIFRGHGMTYDGATDRFYTSAVENALALVAEQRVRVTFMVIAGDLENREKRAPIESVVKAGHNVACHGYRHLYLSEIATAAKRDEIFTGKKKIEDALGVACVGFARRDTGLTARPWSCWARRASATTRPCFRTPRTANCWRCSTFRWNRS